MHGPTEVVVVAEKSEGGGKRSWRVKSYEEEWNVQEREKEGKTEEVKKVGKTQYRRSAEG